MRRSGLRPRSHQAGRWGGVLMSRADASFNQLHRLPLAPVARASRGGGAVPVAHVVARLAGRSCAAVVDPQRRQRTPPLWLAGLIARRCKQKRAGRGPRSTWPPARNGPAAAQGLSYLRDRTGRSLQLDLFWTKQNRMKFLDSARVIINAIRD